jgi:hypothetical protein
MPDAATRAARVVADLHRIDQEWRELQEAREALWQRRAMVEARYPHYRRIGDHARGAPSKRSQSGDARTDRRGTPEHDQQARRWPPVAEHLALSLDVD